MTGTRYDESCFDRSPRGDSSGRDASAAQSIQSEHAQREWRTRVIACLDRLHPALQQIIDTEIKRGNKISDAGEDYPDPGSVHVTLSRKFTDRYQSAQAKFSLCDDPHYWYADYSTKDQPRHLLIC